MASSILIFLHGPKAGQRFTLDGDEFTIGRGQKNEIVLEDSQVSRVHAILMRRGGIFLTEDLGSHNGTYVNDERLMGPRQIHHGDRITIGRSRIMFEDPMAVHDDQTEISTPMGLGLSTFTQRQVQVLRLMARGLTNIQIGERLFVSERTVKAYVTSIFEKLGVSKRAAAVAEALRLGLIDPVGDTIDDQLN